MTLDRYRNGFTLAELLVSLAVFALLVLFVARLFSTAASLTTIANKHIDSDLQARQLFDRMAIDLAQMIKRPDIDYYVKSIVDTEPGNDRIAFFSQVPGYYPSTGSQSPTSLVAYRIYSPSSPPSPCPNCNKMQRMAKGLLWNGVSTTNTPLVFGLTAIVNTWPAATNSSTSDADYETFGPQTFRFEYFYFMKDGTLGATPGSPGMQDVAGISVCLAVVDPKSKLLLSNTQLNTLAGQMKDFDPTIFLKPGDMLAQWQSIIYSTTNMPRAALSAVRLYQRTFTLVPKF
jgi:prepilin-type N-terminal cleavage/methylation domain-containing protein